MLAAVYEPTGISGTVAHILQEINLAFIATLFFAQLPGGGTGGGDVCRFRLCLV